MILTSVAPPRSWPPCCAQRDAAVAPWAKEKGEEIKDRVNPLIDVDVFGGVLLPYRDSLFVTSERNENKTPLDQKLGRALPTFGMTFEAGTTF